MMVSPVAEMELAASYLGAGQVGRAASHARRAIALAPDETDPAFLLALTAHQAGLDPETAYRRTLALAPDHVPASINLAGWLAGRGRPSDAALRLRRVVVLAPAVPQALGNLALALRGTEPPAIAVRRLRRVLAIVPDDASTMLNLGDALAAADSVAAAISAMRGALRVAPDFAQAHHGLALLLQKIPVERQLPGEMLASLRRACVLEPGFAGAWSSLAAALAESDREATLRLLGRALCLDAAEPTALGTLANVWRRQGYLGPESRRHSWSVRNMSIAWRRQGHIDAARGLRRQLVALNPEIELGLNNLALSALDRGEIELAALYLRRALSIAPDRVGIHNNLLFCLTYDPKLTDEALFAAYQQWERRHAAPLYRLIEPHGNEADPARRLRVGYLSADFRDHAIAWLIEGLLAAHDPKQVEPICYAEVARPDAVTERLKRLVPQWRSTVGLSDHEVAAMIRADKVDILVILAGHTATNRIRVAALKPAPIQINLHNLSTSGLASVDYWLTDPALHPESGTREGMTERLLRVPSLYLHNLPSDAPTPGSLPASTAGRVTFGSFSNPAKLNQQVIALWSAVLQSVPGAQLRLGYLDSFADASVQDAFRRRFAAFGVADRVSFLADEPDRTRHLARVAGLDIALDPFPFNGGTTTFEALWMGVPVITLAGGRFAGRCGVTHLTQVGLEDLIAESESDYRDIAVALARDLGRLAEIRRTLRQRVTASPLADPKRYAGAVEAAYRTAWHAWCASASGR